MTERHEKGVWKRTLKLMTNIRIPWLLYVLQVILGFISTNVALKYIPYYTKMQTGNIQDTSVIWGYLGFALLSALASMAYAIPSFYSQALVARRLQNRLISHSLRMGMGSFEKNASQLVGWITNDCTYADGIITQFVGLITGIYGAVLSVSEMNAINTSMLIILPAILLYAVFDTWLEGKLLFLRERRGRRATAELTAYMTEHLSFFTQIRQLHSAPEEVRRGKEAAKLYFKAEVYMAFLTLAIGLVGGALSDIITILIFLMGVPMVRRGEIAITDLVAFQNYINIAYQNLSSIPALYTQLMYYNGQLFYLSSLMAEPEERYEGRSMDVEDRDIVFDNVSFGYGEKEVLKNVSFTFPRGKLTVLVGPNGSGKTTLFKLLERFYTPTDGEIRFGEYRAPDMDLGEWRQSFAYVLQEPQLFDGTVRENIAYGLDREVSDEEVESAARLARADEFIKALPGGYGFEIGENGCRLSAGQRQRIAIARAVMLDPAYLLLDEATCNLDVVAEQEVTEALLVLMRGRTTVMISHNMEMLRRADHVVVLNNGVVEASGNRDEAEARSPTLNKLLQATA